MQTIISQRTKFSDEEIVCICETISANCICCDFLVSFLYCPKAQFTEEFGQWTAKAAICPHQTTKCLVDMIQALDNSEGQDVMPQWDAKASTIILQSYGHAKERHIVEVRCASVTQAWLPDPGRQPALENRCRTHSGPSVSPPCPTGLYHVLTQTLKLNLSQYIFL